MQNWYNLQSCSNRMHAFDKRQMCSPAHLRNSTNKTEKSVLSATKYKNTANDKFIKKEKKCEAIKY